MEPARQKRSGALDDFYIAHYAATYSGCRARLRHEQAFLCSAAATARDIASAKHTISRGKGAPHFCC